MRALVKTGPEPEDLALSDVGDPGEPSMGQVRLEVVATGICATDLHIIEGGFSSSPPVILGHEVAGVVEAVGSGVSEDLLGARVSCETFFSTCQNCSYCRSGRPNLCDQRISIGSRADGGFAERMLIPAINLRVLPDKLPTSLGALCEPLACVVRAMFWPTPSVVPGDRVTVAGPGPIGLLAAQVARAAGGDVRVVGLEADAERLSVAGSLGFATATAGPAASNGVTVAPDVYVECSGAGPSMTAGLAMLRKGGRFVQIGQTDALVPVPLALASFSELTITGGFASTPASWDKAFQLLADQVIDLEPLVSATYPLADWREAFDATARGDGMKKLITPNDDRPVSER